MIKKLVFLVVVFLVNMSIILSLSNYAFAQVDTAWVRRYDGQGNNDEAGAMVLDGEGNLYVTGKSQAVFGGYDYATVKYYPNGDTAWVRRYNGLGNSADMAQAAAVQDTSGQSYIYVTGGSIGSGTLMDYATILYYSNGDTAWVRRYNGPGNDYDGAKAICVNTTSPNVYVAGTSTHAGGTFPYNLDYCTIKYSFYGDTAWVRRYNGPANGPEDVTAMGIDRLGNVYVTGESPSDSIGLAYDFLTIKYYPNGDTAWVRRYNVPGGSTAQARAIAIDTSFNVYVIGITAGGVTGWDYATVKYYPNGDTAWTRRYNGSPNGSDLATAMALDRLGNIYVTGSSESGGSGTPKDFVTIKYRPNGDTAWVRRYSEPGNSHDLANDITVDHGNVYITGSSYDGVSSYDYLTVKYYPDGNFAWVRRYNGPGNYTDETSAIAVDESTNVYVTGQSYGSGVAYDYATIKYQQYYLTDTLRVIAFSPVDLIVTDPQGDSIGIGFNTIPGAVYDTTQDYNQDGDYDDIVIIPNRLVGNYLIRVVAEPGESGEPYDLGIRIDGTDVAMLAMNQPAPAPGEVDTFSYYAPPCLNGDVNGDLQIALGDVVYLISYLYKSGPAPDPVERGDVNSDGMVALGDVVNLITYLYKGGPTPPCWQ